MPHTKLQALVYDVMPPSIKIGLEQMGIATTYNPAISRQQMLATGANYHLLIGRTRTALDAEMLAAMPNLKLIARGGAGLDDIDMEVATRRGIAVINAPEGNRDAVAQHTLGLLLALLNNIVRANKEVQNNIWEREGNRTAQLSVLTVGVIGYGNMGRAFARLLQPFGCKVLAYDKYLEGPVNADAEMVSIQALQQQADVVSLHLPLTAETREMVNSTFLSAFAKPIHLINTGRGKTVVLSHLVDALNSGHVLSAGLDVLENEKLASLSPAQQVIYKALLAMPNVVVTPHIAGLSTTSPENINAILLQKIMRWKSALSE